MTKPTPEPWSQSQHFENSWWGNCAYRALEEEYKQMTYMMKMGLTPDFRFHGDFKGKKVLDVGCGPTSMLLRGDRVGAGSVVADPLMFKFPDWVRHRYITCGLDPRNYPGEELDIHFPLQSFDLAIMYNCLQHTVDPEKICKNLRLLAKEVRIFEWIAGVSPGHPQALKPELLDLWLGGQGTTEKLTAYPTNGTCYYGIFDGLPK